MRQAAVLVVLASLPVCPYCLQAYLPTLHWIGEGGELGKLLFAVDWAPCLMRSDRILNRVLMKIKLRP